MAPIGAYEPARSASGAAVALLGICAGWPVLSFVVHRVASGGPSAMVVHTALTGLESLLQFAATIAFLVWIYRVFVALHQEGLTRHSPGMGVGGWFIPFGNLVLPYLTVREAWDRKMGSDRSFIVPLWWATFLLTTLYRLVWQVAEIARMFDLLKVLGAGFPLPMLIRITAYVSWLLIVRWLTDKAVQTPAQPAYPS